MSDEKNETISDIVTEIRKRAEEVYSGQDGYPESWKNQMDYGEIYELADRIEAAHNRECEETIEKSSVVGNSSKMRNALMEASIALSWATYNDLTTGDANNCLKIVDDALSSPSRNCDNPLAMNLIGAVTLYCNRNPGMPPMVEWNAIQYLEFCKWMFRKEEK